MLNVTIATVEDALSKPTSLSGISDKPAIIDARDKWSASGLRTYQPFFNF